MDNSVTEPEEAAVEQQEPADEFSMSLIGHLEELRRRLLYSCLALLVAVPLCYLAAEPLYNFLVQPLAKAYAAHNGEGSQRLIYTNLTEAFFTYLKTALFAGVFVAFPVISYQLWRFVAPGLYNKEKNAFLPFLIASPVLFILGGAVAYYLVLPLAWEFFLSFQNMGGDGDLAIELEAKVSEYLSLIMKIIMAFGICFQLPILLLLLAKAGLVTAKGLANRRRYAVVVGLVFAALLTPPDIISQLGLALPMMGLYELSIVLIRIFVEKPKKKLKEEPVA